MQQQMSSFAKTMGARVAAANVEHKDKPIDIGNRQLPPGIREGIAKLSAMYTKEYPDDKNGPGTKGQTFFRASAIVVSPEAHNGEKVSGRVTQLIIPLCDMPAKGLRKSSSFSQNWYEFQNVFKLLGIAPPNETPQTDPTGQRVEAYYFAAMKTLTDITRPPTYIEFSTRGWTPPATPANPNPNEIIFETWHGLAEFNGQFNPAGGVTESPAATQPEPFTEPPLGQTQYPAPQLQVQFPDVQLTTTAPTDPADEVAALVEVAMNDPEGATEEGLAASSRLEDMAWAAGWTKEQTASPPAPYTNDWAGIGDMVLNPPTRQPVTQAPALATPPAAAAPTVAVGSRWKFAKRTKDGAKLKNAKGKEFPPQDVEVMEVDAAVKLCTVKSAKDGKPITDIRTKKPVGVKFEWLEPV